jgi:hypothetical protein
MSTHLYAATVTFEVLREGLRLYAEAVKKAAEALKGLVAQFAETVNDPVHVAGLEGRYYVRGGLDPAYADPAALDTLIQEILDGAERNMALLTSENRRRVAVQAARGWAVHRAGLPRPEGLTWGRALGDTNVLVTREEPTP